MSYTSHCVQPGNQRVSFHTRPRKIAALRATEVSIGFRMEKTQTGKKERLPLMGLNVFACLSAITTTLAGYLISRTILEFTHLSSWQLFLFGVGGCGLGLLSITMIWFVCCEMVNRFKLNAWIKSGAHREKMRQWVQQKTIQRTLEQSIPLLSQEEMKLLLEHPLLSNQAKSIVEKNITDQQKQCAAKIIENALINAQTQTDVQVECQQPAPLPLLHKNVVL